MFELSLLINNLHLHFDYIVSIGICVGFSNILDSNVFSTACKSHYNKNSRMTKTPDGRDKETMSEYSKKFKRLDRVFMEESCAPF